MDSPKSRLQDATLISAPGTPYAFSTAIKPSGSFSHEPTNGQSSLHEIKESLSPDLSILNSSLTGRLSLDSVYSSKDGKTASHDRSDNVDLEALNNEQRSGLRSPNDTVTSESLGILDLDAMQDSSMTSFPTSPVTTEGLHLYLSETTSVPPSTQISLAPPPSTQISLAPLIKPLSHREEATQPLTRESGVPVCVPSNDPGYGRDLYDITVGDESQDIESDLSLSEGELEQLNATLTGDETDKSMSRENSSYISTPEKNKQVDAVTTINKVAVDNNATIPSTCTTPLTDCSATSSTSSVQTSLPSSLTDLAKSLGTSEDNTTPRHEGKVHSFGAGCIDGDDGVYNPFDSEDYIGSGLGDFEFDEQNPVSFLEQLDKDEQEIRRTELTPPISQLKSFSSSNPGSFIKEADVNVSITSYFREKSDKIGQLSAKLPPDERPHFNDSVSHVIQSPPSLMNTPTTCHMTPSTLTKPTVSPPIINPSVPTFDGLTPVVTSNTSPSAQVQIPKLNLTDVSRLSSEHRQLVSEASRSSDQGLPSIYFKSSPSPHISTEGASLNASLSPSSEQGLPSVYFKSSPSPHTSAEGTILNASLSPSSEQGLPSMYFKTDSSTLIFPDLSTVSSLPSGCEPPDNMATPPSAYLPVGFNFTEVSTFLEPTSLSLSMDMSLPGGGDGSHSVVVDSTQNTVCSSNTEILNTSSNTQSVHTPDVQPTIHSPVVALKAHSTTPSADLSLSTPTLPASQNAPLTNSQATPTTTNSLFVNNRPNLSTGPSLKEHSSTRPKDFHGSVDPKLIASGEKLAQLQSVLDASQFDVEAFLNTLKGTSPPNIAPEVSTAHSLVTTSSVTTTAHSTPQDLSRYSVTTTAHSTPQDLSRYSVTTTAHSTPSDLPVSLISASQARSNHTMLTHTPILDPASTQSPSPRLQSLAPPPAHSLVYTSPRSTISHVTQSGSRCAESAISPKSSPPMVIPSSWLQVANSLCFSRVCCVCDSVRESLAIHNSGDRWLQVTFELSQIYRDGLEVSHDPDKVFGVPHKVFIGPGHKEQMKVTFSPSLEGSYDAALSLFACLVVSNNRPSTPLATVIIKALAESPKLEITTPSTQGGTETGPVLEFGALVGGTSVSLPVGLSNHGRCTLPLRVTVNCMDQLSRLYFSLNDSSNEAHPSPRSHPQSCSLLLLPQSHSQSYTVQLQLSAPKSHGHDASSPPLELRGSLDVTVDSPNGSLPVTSIPIHATVGTARLLAPGLFKSNDFSLSCVTGQTKSESVPLKNAGNISLTVRVKISSAHSSLFKVSPSSIQLLPGEESHLDVTFGPTSEPLISEATLMIHVEPSGPDYNLKLKGVALQVPSSHVDTPTVLSVRTLTLPETEVGGCSEGVLDIHNPYPSTLQWTLTPVASPFLRKVSSIGSGDMFKVNYPVFQAHTGRQSLLPHATDKVKVLFQPQEDGMFSQIWGIQVCSSQAEDQTIRLSFGGKAHPISSPKRREPPATIPPHPISSPKRREPPATIPPHPISSPKRRELPATIPPHPISSPKRREPPAPIPPPSIAVSSHHYHEGYTKDERKPREKQRSHDTRVTFKEDPVRQDQHDPKKIKQISKWLSQVSHTPSFHPPTPSHHPPTHHTPSHHPPTPSHHPPTHHTLSHHPPTHHTPSHHPPTHHTPSHHPPTHPTPSHSTYTTPCHPPLPRVSPSNRSAYMREDEITFPPTKPGTRSTVKVQVCNKNVPLCKFTVIQLGQPFSVDHRSFDLGARQCARLPVHFTPEAPGRFEGILAIKTNHKHQMFAVLKGESPKL